MFYKIQDIVRNKCVLLVTSQLKTVGFDEHLFAYRIDHRPSTSLKVFTVNELTYYKPVDVQMSYGSDNLFCFIVPYCNLIQILLSLVHVSVKLMSWFYTFYISVQPLVNFNELLTVALK